MSKSHLVTVVIPCKNEEGLIGPLLESLSNQDIGKENIKIFVADGGSTDKTPEIVRKFSSLMDIEIIPGGLPAVGRNNGAKMAETDYVLFLDADMYLSQKSLLRKSLNLAKKKKLDCLTASIFPRQFNFFSFILYLFNNLAQYLSIILGRPYATGMFMLFRKERFFEIGGFDEKILYAEDFFLSKQVSRKKFGIVSGYILTTDRRFKKSGHFKIVKMFLGVVFHANDKKYFYRDESQYWK